MAALRTGSTQGQVGAALLRRRIEPAPGPRTPARVEALQGLVAAGVVPAAAAADVIAGGRVDDPTWAEVRDLVHFLEVPIVEARVWRVRLRRLAGSEPLAMPVVGKTDDETNECLPVERLDRIRLALAQRGWRLDKATFRYDDWWERSTEEPLFSELADDEWLAEVRFLLVRAAGNAS